MMNNQKELESRLMMIAANAPRESNESLKSQRKAAVQTIEALQSLVEVLDELIKEDEK